MSDALFDAFAALSERRFDARAGTALFRRGDPVNQLYLVQSGRLELLRYLENGQQLTLDRAKERTILAEASIYAEHYHCDALVTQDATLQSIERARIIQFLAQDSELGAAWAAHLAKSLQNARHRSEILSRKTVLERLEGWLDWNDGALPPKGQWKELAGELCVTPEALYRTIARIRPKP